MIEALVIVDVQNDYFPGGNFPTWQPIETATAISKLIKKFREEGKEVIHVQHIIKKEQEKDFPFFIEGTPGVEFHDLVKPLPTEKIVKKNEISSFCRTDLEEYLKSKGITNLIVVGMMIHNCVNSTVYSAVEAGFPSIVVNEAVNTFDQEINGELLQAKDIKKAFLAGIQFAFSKVYNLEDVMNDKHEYRAL